MPSEELVVVSEHLDDACVEWLGERYAVRRVAFDDAAFDDAIGRAAGLVVRTYTQVNEELLAKAPNLRVVARAGVAIENIDVGACRMRGVEVVHTPGANTQAVVELVTAYMLDALRPRVFLDRGLEQAEWGTLRKELKAAKQLSDCTLGIIGFGRIGTRMAQMARAIGMRAVYSELREVAEADRFGAEPVDLDALLSGSDVITVHVDDRPGNHRFLAASEFTRLQDDALFINTSRGFVIDPLALAAFLRDHPAAQAIIDVHDPEPVREGDPLLGLPNCRLSPHIGAATATAHRNMSWVVRDVDRVLRGERPEHPAPDRSTDSVGSA